MAQQDQHQKCSNNSSITSGGVGKSSRKQKQKKVPQRGLGVAQLEKIRIEEQHRKEAASASAISPSKSYYNLPLSNFHHFNQLSVNTGSANFPVHHGNVPSLSYESNPTWCFSNWTHRTQPYQQTCSSMMNVSIEPPSNQNCCGSCVPMKPEEKMMGLKRSYPFSLDVPLSSSFNFKLPTFTAYMEANETMSCGLNFDAANSTFREVPSCSTEPNLEKSNKENENFSADFLTLGPPSSPSKFKSASATSLAFHNQECPDFESPSSQGITEDQIQKPLHSFFPPKKEKIVETTTTRSRVENCNGGREESVDLNLRL